MLPIPEQRAMDEETPFVFPRAAALSCSTTEVTALRALTRRRCGGGRHVRGGGRAA